MIMYMYKIKSEINTANPLYSSVIAVTNRHLCSRPFMEQIDRVCSLNPKAVILREKDLSEQEYLILAENVLEICKQYQVPCILHSFVEVARALKCSAIHLPLPLLHKYEGELKDFSTVGTSVHSVEDALEAEELGASYLTAGHIYATDCKKGVPPRGTVFLKEVCQSVSLPVYAIGGIQPDQAQFQEIMDCGAKGGCIMSGMMTL